MSQSGQDTCLSIRDLSSVVTLLCARARYPLSPDAQEPIALRVRYLRRKPGRGLAVIYSAGDGRLAGQRGQSSHAPAVRPTHWVSLTLDERALDGARVRFNAAQARHADLEAPPSGILRARDLGLTVHAFPADAGLPALAASCDCAAQGPLFRALEAAARTQLRDDAWRLVSAQAEPIRYKPASRCVLRYDLMLEHAPPHVGGAAARRRVVLFGKVYADPAQARSVHLMMEQLYDEQMRAEVHASAGQAAEAPLLPRPLGLSVELGLTLTEAAGRVEEDVDTAAYDEPVVPGAEALRPTATGGRRGVRSPLRVPREELRLAATALARLHAGTSRPDDQTPRTGAREAARARERAVRLAAGNPAQAAEIMRLAERLAGLLEGAHPDAYRPAHGGFKPSQVLFHHGRVFVVDFDGFGLADAALDVGYFLAYLRPSGLWYHRPGLRPWFTAAAQVFVDAYRRALRDRGVPHAAIDGIVARSRLYEAALLFKIATRRVNRLNSPRIHELSAMLAEIAACLPGETRTREQ